MKRIIVLMAFITLQLAYAQQYDISTDYKFTYLLMHLSTRQYGSTKFGNGAICCFI